MRLAISLFASTERYGRHATEKAMLQARDRLALNRIALRPSDFAHDPVWKSATFRGHALAHQTDAGRAFLLAFVASRKRCRIPEAMFEPGTFW
jgi:hypothetical protein